MNFNPRIPLPLRITAWLFILNGASTLISTLVQLFHRQFHLDLGFLWLFVGLGILRLSNGWRWIGVIGLLVQMVTFVIMLFSIRGIGIPAGSGRVFGLFPIMFSKTQGLIFLVAVALILIFQLSALLAPSTDQYFKPKPSSA